MGIRGLTSFFEENPQFFSDHELHDTYVVMDANNVLHQLYFNSELDCIYGGDFNKFAKLLVKYFDFLSKCHIKPVLVFDGAFDKSNRKFNTSMQRIEKSVSNVRNLNKTGKGGKILPLFASQVLKNVLDNMGIAYQQCDYEADDYIAALANSLECPVISNDSDFFIFDVKYGFIRFDTLDNQISYNSENSFKSIKCKIYFNDKFLSHFPGFDKQVLPLFASLMGNDYVDISTFDNFFANISLPKFKGKLKVSQRHKRMIGLLAWLSNRTLEESISLVLNSLKTNARASFKSVIDEAVAGYLLQKQSKMNEIKFLDVNPPTTHFNNRLPDWFVEKSRKGKIHPHLLNIVSVRYTTFSMQIEDISMESTKICSGYIRQVLYGIVMSHDAKSGLIDEKVCEYIPSVGTMQKNMIQPLFSINGYGKLPSLCEIENLDCNDSRKLVACVIGDSVSFFDPIPSQLHLFVGAIRYCLRNCTPKPSMEFFDSLLLTTIYFNTVKPLYGLSEFAISIKKEELHYFKTKMKKYSLKKEHNNANPFLVTIVHSFNQLQSCIFYLMILNNLLGMPFEHVLMENFFGGVTLYNLVADLSKRKDPKLFVSELLGRKSELNILFLELKSKILEGVVDYLSKGKKIVSKKSKKLRRIGGVKMPISHWIPEVDLDKIEC